MCANLVQNAYQREKQIKIIDVLYVDNFIMKNFEALIFTGLRPALL